MSLLNTLHTEIQSIHALLIVMNAALHVLFAGAVARDAGALAKQHRKTHLVGGTTWAFATLVGGVFVAALYWAIHHTQWLKTQ
jgi:hypothetical protein